MPFINQETKKIINEELKKFVPKTWKYTLSIQDNRCLHFNLKSADINLLRENETYKTVNINYIEKYFSGNILEIFEKIKIALNLKNWNNSDVQTDYFDVGYCININIGAYDKPFKKI